MSISKRSDGRYYLNVRPYGSKGKQVKRIFTTYREAKSFEVELLSGKFSFNNEKLRLNDLIQKWFDAHGQTLKSSIDTRDRLFKISEFLGNPLASDLDGSMFSSYREKRLFDGISKATLNRELSTLKSVYRELIRLNFYIGSAPILKVRKFKEESKELSFLTLGEIEILLIEVRKSSNWSLEFVVLISLATGARWSEVESLSFYSLKDSVIQFSKTKNGRIRFVPISDRLSRFYIQYFDDYGLIKPCYSAFRSAFSRTKIITPSGQLAHILRHTFASHFMANGGSILTLQKILGHSSLQMTMRYSHLAPGALEEAVILNPLYDGNGLNVVY